ncbi:conserved hypothetical protein [Massilia sp. 9I]|nr:conserved hypothetical protein [Massilia sp. 9I]
MALGERVICVKVCSVSQILYKNHADPSALPKVERDSLIMTQVSSGSEISVPVSYYGDMVWDYTPHFPHAARGKSDKEIYWEKSPPEWVESLKSVVSAFTYKKPLGGVQLDPATLPKRAITLNAFAKWCSASGIRRFRDVRAFDLARYLQKLRSKGVVDRTLASHVAILRRVYDMRRFIVDSFTDEAVSALRSEEVGPLWEPDAGDDRRTELIPLRDAAQLFSAALGHLNNADNLLNLRDYLDADWALPSTCMSRRAWGDEVKKVKVREAGFKDVYDYESALIDIRTAAYIVLAQSTGCRVHELGDIRSGCVYSEVVNGVTYWWLKSTTRKVGDGPQRWLAPEIVKKAVAILERFSQPLQRRVVAELAAAEIEYCAALPADEGSQLALRILELKRNSTRLFLSASSRGVVSTDTKSHNKQLQAFAQRRGIRLASNLSTHRFRRTYAVIVVHLNKGHRIDLVTLQHHYKHASMLMTEWYAKLPETDKELYELIEEETSYFDLALVSHWMENATPLAGGLGSRIKAYPGRHHQPMFFKSHKDFVESIREGLNIRSTGHSWCLGEAKDCGGRGLFEAPRCDGCAKGVIDDHFTDVWRSLREQQIELIELDDIGPGGQDKVRRSLAAADAVLAKLISKGEGENV